MRSDGAERNHRKVEIFSSFDEAMAQVKRIESLRIKHDYQVA